MLLKFCCCWDLRYGWIAFATIIMVLRISLSAGLITVFSYPYLPFTIACDFWNFAAIALTVMAMKGVIKKRSILLYPSIVLSTLEIVLTVVVGIVLACAANPLYVLYVLVAGGIFTYYTITLYSLHQLFKHIEDCGNEDTHRLRETV